jgi:hypothetical protein
MFLRWNYSSSTRPAGVKIFLKCLDSFRGFARERVVVRGHKEMLAFCSVCDVFVCPICYARLQSVENQLRCLRPFAGMEPNENVSAKFYEVLKWRSFFYIYSKWEKVTNSNKSPTGCNNFSSL